MYKFTYNRPNPIFLVALVLTLSIQACATNKAKSANKPDPEKVQQASIMTNKCLLTYHDIPGSLTQRQDCLNRASGMLMDGYGAEIQNVARLCAQKLSQLAAEGDSGQVDLKGYQQKREMLKMECAQEAQAAQK
jgi:hypothetical protein